MFRVCNGCAMYILLNYTIYTHTQTHQGQKFIAVLKAKNRGAATSQNAKNRGKNRKKSRRCRGLNRENRGFVAANILLIAALSRRKRRS